MTETDIVNAIVSLQASVDTGLAMVECLLAWLLGSLLFFLGFARNFSALMK